MSNRGYGYGHVRKVRVDQLFTDVPPRGYAINEEGYNSIKKSIANSGIQRPLLVVELPKRGSSLRRLFQRRRYQVIDGHVRLKAAVDLGIQTVEVAVADATLHLDDAETYAAKTRTVQRVDRGAPAAQLLNSELTSPAIEALAELFDTDD